MSIVEAVWKPDLVQEAVKEDEVPSGQAAEAPANGNGQEPEPEPETAKE